MELIERGGEYLCVADPGWPNPLDGSFSMQHGGRWNAPGTFPVVYLNREVGTARANARRMLTEKLHGQPFGAEDLDPSELPILVTVDVPARDHLDVVTPKGIVENGLPATYPTGFDGARVPWDLCQPVGQMAWDRGLPGIACRSAAEHAPPDGEELAWFDRQPGAVQSRGQPVSFEGWYGPFDW